MVSAHSMPSPDPAIDGLDPEKLLAAAMNSTPASSPAFAWVPPPPEEVAPWFPEYEVQALAGRGAMGAVYRAVQRKLGRPVAIKLLPAELATRDGVEARFEREARALAQLNHPGIVALHDFGRTAGGHLFIVMECVDGTDLSRLIHAEGGGLSVPHALEIVGQVCDALQYAHGRGFVHRDIKPGNVLVDKEGRVKIADFGLAKVVEAAGAAVRSAASHSALTATGAAVGTPDYTAPEQLKGGPVDHRADIYSLGVMFYEMLTGELPRGAWTPPSQRTAAPARLDEVVTRAMQNEPDKRYQQASEVKAAVAGTGTLASVPVPAPASAGSPRSSLNRLLMWLMVVFVVVASVINPTSDVLNILLLAGPFIVLAVFFRFKRRPAGLVSVMITGMAMGAVIFLAALQIAESPRPAKVTGQTTAPPLSVEGAAQPGERAIADMNALIDELADAQVALERGRQIGITRFWSGEEQQQFESRLKHFAEAVQSRTAAGFAADDSRVKEAQQRLALLQQALIAMKLPDIAPENCVSREFRAGSALNTYFPEGEDLIPGLRVHCWKGQHQRDAAAYYVESRAMEEDKPMVVEGEKTLEHFPEFWPLEMPLERPRLPPGSPQSNAELEWIARTWPKECAEAGLGLVVQEFAVQDSLHGDEPQLNWTHWSPSSEDLVPWAPGEPRAGGAAERGRIVFRGGKCYTVFDTAPRPQLFGGIYADVMGWAARTLVHHEVPFMLLRLTASEAERKQFPATPEWHREIQSRYGDLTVRESAGYYAELAKSAPPWHSWVRDLDHLSTAQDWMAGTNSGGGIPFHRWRGGRILVTKFVCSRPVAEKIAAACGARLPVPDNQDDLDELARLVPSRLMAHSGIVPGAAIRGMRLDNGDHIPWLATEDTPAPAGVWLAVHGNRPGESSGYLFPVPSRALLMLEWPDVARKTGQDQEGD